MLLRAAPVLLLVVVTACSSTTSGTSSSNGSPSSGSSSSGDGTGGGGTCDSACTYYLGCKGLSSDQQAECVEACVSQGYTPAQLASFEEMECAAAVAAIEGGSSSGGSSSGGSSSGGADCFGCQHDGTSCIYIGPMGGHSQCDASCC